MLVCGKKKVLLQAVRKEDGNGNSHPLLPFPQPIPQYIEVPPNIEGKRIISYFSPILSY
jgi:hypothetical protein